METLRVLIVDDSSLLRKVIKDALSTLPGIDVVGMVSNGSDALLRVASLKPDIVTLDVEMPGMNGIEVLSKLQESDFPGVVVMLSSFTEKGAPFTIKALELGAFDFILKPSSPSIEANLAALREKFLPITQALGQRKKINNLLRGGSSPVDSVPKSVSRLNHSAQYVRLAAHVVSKPSKIVVIGVSTGGPKALAQIIPKLPVNLSVPVVIVQHMPEGFTEEFAKSLNAKSPITVKEVEDGETIRPATVYVAPGGRQMKLVQSAADKIFQITDDPPENNCRPSVDYLFRSVSKLYAGDSTAIVLTGMGKDGAAGAQLLKSRGARIIVQDEETSVVFGMPKAVIDLGVADVVCPLHKIVAELGQNLSES